MNETKHYTYPFTAVVGQDEMKLALILNMIRPNIGGVLILGEKGTAKSTLVRALASLMHDRTVVELPIATTEDKLVGSIDIEHAIKSGETRFEPGILHKAHGNILYIDEVNLLEDHLVDILLDVAAMGVNHIEREGISYAHPSSFVLVGTMNPEEGDLRPQLLDRFGLSVEVHGEREPAKRVEILERRLAFDKDKAQFIRQYEPEEAALRKKIEVAGKRLPHVKYSQDIMELIARIGIELQVDGHRADITMLKCATALAAFNGREEVLPEDVYQSATFALPHRLRRLPFDSQHFTSKDIESLISKA